MPCQLLPAQGHLVAIFGKRRELFGKTVGLDGVMDKAFSESGIAAEIVSKGLQQHPTLQETIGIRRLGLRRDGLEIGFQRARAVVWRRIATASGRPGSSGAVRW